MSIKINWYKEFLNETKNLKKAILASMFTITSQVFAYGSDGIYIPRNFHEVEDSDNTLLFSNRDKTIFVLIADISGGARLEHKTFGYSNGMYLKDSIRPANLASNAFAIVNGAFFYLGKWNAHTIFSQTYTKIMHPFTPGNPVWNTSEKTRTLCIKDNNRAVVDNTGYNKRDYSKACKFSITLLHPSVSKDRNSKIGRNYIGVSRDNSKVLFFLSTESTQADMERLIKSWGIPDYHIIMGDGSGSAQMRTKRNILLGYNGALNLYGRTIPHLIQIFPYWFYFTKHNFYVKISKNINIYFYNNCFIFTFVLGRFSFLLKNFFRLSLFCF